MKLAIISPCFNEEETVLKFLDSLSTTLSKSSDQFEVVIIDDSSTDKTVELLKEYRASQFNFHLLTLDYNIGHQAAIYQGLLFISDLDFDATIVMDSDGEDDPESIIQLVEKYKETNTDIINVIRGQRKEGFVFRCSYFFYKLLFRMITKKEMNFGNYCLISSKVVNISVATSFIHFAAHLSKLKINRDHIIFDRGKRIGGRSKMNLDSLMNHAFKSFVEYGEQLLMIFFKLFIMVVCALIGVGGYILYRKLFTDKAVLGWASTLGSSLINTALLCLGFFILGTLLLNVINRQKLNIGNKTFKKMM